MKLSLSTLRVGLLLLAIAGGCATAGPSYKLNLKPYQLDMTDFNFPSGLRILFQEDRTEPTVLVTGLYGVGSTSEPVGKEGIAHLVEHLCFKARHGNKPEVMDHIRQLGASDYNAFTSQDITQYYTAAPKEALVELLQIEAQRMLNPIAGVTEEELVTEREVVRNELRLRIENGGGQAFELASEMLYPKDHPYHRSVIGSHESLDNITMADVRAFLKEHYVPSKVTIVVTGDFNRAEAGALIAKTFPRQLVFAPDAAPDAQLALVEPKARITGPSAEPPPPADRSLRRIKGPVASTELILAWSMPGGYRKNQPLIEVTASMLSGAVGSLLYPDSWDPEDDEIEGLGCGASAQPLATTVYCFITLIDGQDPEVISRKAIDGLVEMWNTDNEVFQRKLFASARGDYQAALFRNSAHLGRAVQIAEYMHYTGKPDYFTRAITEVQAINSFDARNLAYKYLTRDRAVTLVIEPYDTKEKPISMISVDGSSSYAGAVLSESANSLVDYSKVTDAQIAALGRAPDVSKVKELTLANGLQVILAKHGSAPFVSVALHSRGGNETVKPARFTEFAARDFTTQDPGKIAAGWFGSSSGDGALFGIEAPSGNVAAAIDLVYDRATSTTSTWSGRLYDRMKETTKRRTKTAEKRPEFWADRALWNLLMPGLPRGVGHDWDALDKVGSADYQRWWKEHLAPKNSILLVVGDIDLAEAEALVTKMWGDWRKTDPGFPLPGYPETKGLPAQQIAFVDDQEATQANIELGCHLTPVSVESEAAKDVLSSMLSQDLWIAIRKKAGASYGVYASDVSIGGSSLLMVGGAIQNDKAVPALRTILERIAELRAGRADPTRLAQAKWSLAAQTRAQNQSNGELLFRLLNVRTRNRPLSSLTTYPQRLAAVKTSDIAAILEPCAGREVITVTGPAKALRSGFESLKIPVEDVDWKKGSSS